MSKNKMMGWPEIKAHLVAECGGNPESDGSVIMETGSGRLYGAVEEGNGVVYLRPVTDLPDYPSVAVSMPASSRKLEAALRAARALADCFPGQMSGRIPEKRTWRVTRKIREIADVEARTAEEAVRLADDANDFEISDIETVGAVPVK